MEQTLSPQRSRMSLWIQAVRAFSFPGTVVPVLVAGMCALALFNGTILWFLYPLIFICAILFHAGSNLVSDYFDFKRKVDHENAYGSSGVLTGGLMRPVEILRGGLICFAIGFSLGMILVYFRGTPILVLGLIGLLGGYFYTAYPINFKYYAFGDLGIFLLFGPLMVIGSYFSLTGEFNMNILYISIPIGFLILGVLHANNTRDIKQDKIANIKTVAMLLGIKGAKMEYYFLVIGAFLSICIMVLLNILSVWSLLVFISFPVALQNMKQMSKADVDNPDLIAMMDVRTAQHHLMFGVLLSIGILISKFI